MKTSKSNNTDKLKVPVECYSRIVGYFRPINQWNKGKKQEKSERHEYHLEDVQKALKTNISKTEQCA